VNLLLSTRVEFHSCKVRFSRTVSLLDRSRSNSLAAKRQHFVRETVYKPPQHTDNGLSVFVWGSRSVTFSPFWQLWL